MQLGRGNSNSPIEAVCRVKCRGHPGVLWRDCWWWYGEKTQVNRGSRGRRVSVMQLVRGGGGSVWDDARKWSTTKSGTASERMNRRKSTCMGMH